MVALCPEHHRKADAGAYLVDQLRRYKLDAADSADEIRGEFEWLRHDIVLLSGSVLYVECGIAIQIGRHPMVWFNRDDSGYALLNVRMPQTGRSSRITIQDNSWIKRGNVEDLVCPVGGRSLAATYANGDELRVEFREVVDLDSLQALSPSAPQRLARPFTLVSVVLKVPGLGLSFDSSAAQIGSNTIQGGLIERCGVGVQIG